MNHRVYRVQDDEGRGPYRVGFSHVWTDADHHNRNPSIFDDFNLAPERLRELWHPSENGGCAFRNTAQLCSWFSSSERRRLEELKYSIVSMLVDRIIFESERQLVFARRRPLRLGVIKLLWLVPLTASDVSHASAVGEVSK